MAGHICPALNQFIKKFQQNGYSSWILMTPNFEAVNMVAGKWHGNMAPGYREIWHSVMQQHGWGTEIKLGSFDSKLTFSDNH